MMVRPTRLTAGPSHSYGFTLVELLVVVFIVLLVSAATLPTVIPALAHRQLGEAARLIQASLAGARDAAIHDNAPRGLRLLPDPGFSTAIGPNGQPTLARLADGSLDPLQILAANRFVPIETAPEYSEGKISITASGPLQAGFTTLPRYPGPSYPVLPGPAPYPMNQVVMVNAEPVDNTTGLPNVPTAWFWNIRVGDKIRINNAGHEYTVVGPMTIGPAEGNVEQFVNDGPAGQTPRWRKRYNIPGNPVVIPAEYLLLVNGVDDDGDGFVDEGWDGINNDPADNAFTDELGEWETEQWLGSKANEGGGVESQNLPYTIRRRPVPASNTREVALPANVVVDLTTWGTTLERSRLPVNRYTGAVDILLNADGSVVPTTLYSSPSSFGLASSFYHIWLAERTDVFPPLDWATHPSLNGLFQLPMLADTPNRTVPAGPTYNALRATNPDLGELKGERRLVTINTRTGQVLVNAIEAFDTGNVNYPFLAPQQGVRGEF